VTPIERSRIEAIPSTVMAAFGTKVVVLMMVLPSLLLLQLQTSSVEAVDILAYNDNGCSGNVGGGCYSIAAGVCCSMNGAAAVEINSLLSGESAFLYTGGDCTTQVASLSGPNAGECYYNDAFSGALWTYNT